jgi:hypothetical protein
MARYSGRWPSGSWKNTDAAGVQLITKGLVVAWPWKSRGSTPEWRRAAVGRRRDWLHRAKLVPDQSAAVILSTVIGASPLVLDRFKIQEFIDSVANNAY